MPQQQVTPKNLEENLKLLTHIANSDDFLLGRYKYLDNLFTGFSLYSPKDNLEYISHGLCRALGVKSSRRSYTPAEFLSYISEESFHEWSIKVHSLVMGSSSVEEGHKALTTDQGIKKDFLVRGVIDRDLVILVYTELFETP